jgi:hypothetical protein
MTKYNETKLKQQQLLLWPSTDSENKVADSNLAIEEDSFEKSCPDCGTILDLYFDDVGNCKYCCDNCRSGIFFYDSEDDADE